MGKYFGTDGFRGEANVDLTAMHAFKIGRYLGQVANERAGEAKGHILIGRDTRLSGTMYESALAAGITASGSDALILGVVTTPGVAYLTRTDADVQFGIMISASHNPFYDNGIKVLNAQGEKLDEATTLQIEAYIDSELEPAPQAQRAEIGVIVDASEQKDAYAEYLVGIGKKPFEMSTEKPFAGKKVALDCSNGSASDLAGRIFTELGAEVVTLSTAYNGVNINLNCGSTHPEALMAYVAEHDDVFAGFAYDGDADRCQGVDENGALLDGDKLMYMNAIWLKKHGKLSNNTVVTTIMSNFGLYKALDNLSIAYEKTAVGDKYVYENMAANKHSIGGEQSGHVIFLDYATTGDGILTSLMTMNALIDTNSKPSELGAPMVSFPQVLKNVRVNDKSAAQNDEVVKTAISAAGEALGNDGRVLVRPSGTEPVIRVMAEAGSVEVCEQHVDAIIEVMRAQGHVIA